MSTEERICLPLEEFEKLIADRNRLNFIEQNWFINHEPIIEFNEIWVGYGYNLRLAIDMQMKDYKGKIIDGLFVKRQDLKYE